MASYYVLQDPNKRAKKSGYYNIPGLKNAMGVTQPALAPTPLSVEANILEWIIPSNPFNDEWIAVHYSHLIKLDSGKELKTVAGPEPVVEAEVVEAVVVEIVEEEPKQLSPKEIKKLKVEASKQLNELGIEFPKNSSLVTLEALLEKELTKDPE